ncbi:hypothetical protein LINPERHAP1_LOCUS24787 [Linum perenne]
MGNAYRETEGDPVTASRWVMPTERPMCEGEVVGLSHIGKWKGQGALYKCEGKPHPMS